MDTIIYNNNEVNRLRLKQIDVVAKRTMGMLLEQADEGVLKSISNKQSFEEYTSYLDKVITTAVRTKLNV